MRGLGKYVRAAAAWGAGILVVLVAGFLVTFPFDAPRVPDYSLAAVRHGKAPVPRDFVASLPVDRLKAAKAAKRKRLFLTIVLPLVLRANETVARDRARLLRLEARLKTGKRLTLRNRQFLAELADRYGTKPSDLTTLRRRVDIVPTSVALAQSAIESAWGTSRFAGEGNALYGIWAWNDGDGLVPKARAKGARHVVRHYDSLLQSVRTYLRTLNTHFAYRSLRQRRAAARRRGALGYRAVLAGLDRYSQKGKAYIALIDKVIRRDKMHEFDRARLAPR